MAACALDLEDVALSAISSPGFDVNALLHFELHGVSPLAPLAATCYGGSSRLVRMLFDRGALVTESVVRMLLRAQSPSQMSVFGTFVACGNLTAHFNYDNGNNLINHAIAKEDLLDPDVLGAILSSRDPHLDIYVWLVRGGMRFTPPVCTVLLFLWRNSLLSPAATWSFQSCHVPLA